MTPHTRIDRALRQRLIAWLDWYVATKKQEGIKITDVELERRLGTARGSVSRIRDGRLGLDSFVKMVELLHKSADTLLFEDPPRHDVPSRGSGSPRSGRSEG